MNGKLRIHIIQLVLMEFVLLCSTFAYGQAGSTEMAALREELNARTDGANPSFEEYQETLSKLLHQKATFNLWRWLSKFLGSADGAGGSRILNTIFLATAVLLLIAGVAFFTQQIRHNLINDAEQESSQSPEDSPFTERAALDRAEAFEVGRDFRGALRSLYLAALLHVHERGLLSYDKSLTNREYLRELKAYPNLQNALRPVIHTFDEIWYGYKPCNADTVATYRGLLQEMYEVSR